MPPRKKTTAASRKRGASAVAPAAAPVVVPAAVQVLPLLCYDEAKRGVFVPHIPYRGTEAEIKESEVFVNFIIKYIDTGHGIFCAKDGSIRVHHPSFLGRLINPEFYEEGGGFSGVLSSTKYFKCDVDGLGIRVTEEQKTRLGEIAKDLKEIDTILGAHPRARVYVRVFVQLCALTGHKHGEEVKDENWVMGRVEDRAAEWFELVNDRTWAITTVRVIDSASAELRCHDVPGYLHMGQMTRGGVPDA